EKTRLAGLNLTAGRAAKAEAAYDAMSEYLAVGITLLPEDGWTSHYDLALRLHEEAAEAAFLTGDFERVEVYSEQVLRRAATLADKIKVYEVKIQTHVARNNPLEAIELAMNILGRMGLVFPEKPTPEVIGQSLMEIVSHFANHEVEGLIDLPEMSDPTTLSAFRVMGRILASLLLAAPGLMPLVICKMVNLSMEHGNTALSAPAYATLGIILCGGMGEIDLGSRFGRLALRLLDKVESRPVRAKTMARWIAGVLHWKEPLRNSLDVAVEASQIALETGDLEYAAISAQIHTYHS
ncbi:MAG: serine/threonine protein kinase, partial [Desulfobacterales bacterium]|nr:serine/threonine protein kinase [Desulfobacterales bacterium]